MKRVYREKLREHHTLIVNSLNLKASGVLDTLEEEVISSDEVEEIMQCKVKKSQNYRFLYFLKRKDSSRKPFEKFICALKGKYDFIVNKLKMDTSTVTNDSDDDQCVYCNLVQVLNPDGISHELFERGAFSDETLNAVNDERLPQSERAKMTLQLIHSCEKTQSFVAFLWNYFRKKYKDITSSAQSISDLTVCSCDRKRQMLDTREKNYVRNRREATRIHCNRRNKTKSEKKVDAVPILTVVKKCLPNDNKLLKRCNRVWEKLWVLREAGKWSEYDDLSKKYLDTYADEPDMLVLLYRHGMARSAFYNEDYGDACNLFEKAMKELPKSTMSNWHMCRIFGLQSQICVRKGQFGEAESYLTKAHQAAELVGPSFASGTVHFYEGIYLSNLLRCRPKGQSASSIFEKAKSCYALSIKHYQEERVFAIQSLLNEVYLFLALLELQVDFKTLKSVHLDVKCTINYPMVEYYLDLFENTCWKISTRWAKMMFFVARAELHKRRNNIERNYLRAIEQILLPLRCQLNQISREVEDESDTDLESEAETQSSADQQSSNDIDNPCANSDKFNLSVENTTTPLSRKRRSRFSTDGNEIPAKKKTKLMIDEQLYFVASDMVKY
ncbi:hypothetical protein KUTeg_007975 [Tegillarca granosa]|uniref:CARD domain-containing protein n=1 Tax=Tegillarca granosa TaxID=220873 RepID=A0ABQ9FJG0_TEGGR|nr:hypothetical protein KUTeg_007975 [Tegillarca granosa]